MPAAYAKRDGQSNGAGTGLLHVEAKMARRAFVGVEVRGCRPALTGVVVAVPAGRTKCRRAGQ